MKKIVFPIITLVLLISVFLIWRNESIKKSNSVDDFWSKVRPISLENEWQTKNKLADDIQDNEKESLKWPLAFSQEVLNERQLKNQEKIRKIDEALQKLDNDIQNMTPQMLAEEQHRLAVTLDEYQNKKVQQPKEELVQDRFGNSWVKLTFPDGIVRYEFPDDPELIEPDDLIHRRRNGLFLDY